MASDGERRRHHRQGQHAGGEDVDRGVCARCRSTCSSRGDRADQHDHRDDDGQQQLLAVAQQQPRLHPRPGPAPSGAAARRPGAGRRSPVRRSTLTAPAPVRSARGRRPRGCAGPGSATRAARRCSAHQAETVASVVASAGPVTSRLSSSSAVHLGARAQRRAQRRPGRRAGTAGDHEPDRRRAGRPVSSSGRARRRSAGRGR